MKDTELRGIVLNAFYENRMDAKAYVGYDDFQLDMEKDVFLHICNQLDEHGLLDWKSYNGSNGKIIDGRGKITADGVDVIESDGEDSSLRIELPVTQNINVTNSQGVQIGNENSQTIISSFEALIQQIEESDASPEEKDKARSKIRELLLNSTVGALIGAGVTALIEALGG